MQARTGLAATAPAGRSRWQRRLLALALVIGLGVALVLWDRGAMDDGARVLAPVGLEVEAVLPASWSNVELTEHLGSGLGDLAQAALAGPDGSGQILAARLFRLGDLEGATTILRRLLDQIDARIPMTR